jgi:predicted phage terminase large subunit-like protein
MPDYDTRSLRKFRKIWDSVPLCTQRDLYLLLNKKERRVLAASWEFLARPNQLAPEDWDVYWLILAGRGFGKTRVGAETTLDHVMELKKEARIALVAPTSADARDVMIEGESGIMACAHRRRIECTYEPSKRRISFENGAVITAYSAEKPDRLRGPQHTFAWCDELSSWEYDQDTWDMLCFGLRLGPKPQVIITTTPKPRKLMSALIQDPRTTITRGSTYDNKDNLAESFLTAVEARYEGTRLGRQELYGELLEDNPDALWQPSMIDGQRIKAEASIDYSRIVVGIDPAVTSGEAADETGIIVAAADEAGHYYILDDLSGRYTPDEWARVAVKLYDEWKADRIVAEVNQGGDMVEHTLRTVRKGVPFKGVRATRGKRVRAEPISALYEQAKVSHVGIFTKLEDQMCSFSPDSYDGSPDRLDALVWALTELSGSTGSGISFL